MKTMGVQDGDTWESISQANCVALSSLLVANGLDPKSCPNPPEIGSTVAIPDPPPAVAAAPGENHVLDAPAEACLWLRLDMSPEAARNTSDSVRLYSDDGTHDVTLTIADHFTECGSCVDVLFDSLDPTLSYSMDYLTPGTQPITVVNSTPFSSLQDDSLPDPDPAASPTGSTRIASDAADRSVPPISEATIAGLAPPGSTDAMA
jgi:hypothetical protein